MRWHNALLILFAACVFAPMAEAHHSTGYDFDRDKTVTVSGVVKEVWWSNPHVRLYVTAAGANGGEVVWDANCASPNELKRRGWIRSSVKVGDHVTITGNPGRNGKKMVALRKIKLANGTVLGVALGGKSSGSLGPGTKN